MNLGDEIHVILSCGKVEDGIISNPNFIDEFGFVWLELEHKTNSNLKLRINKDYIAGYQITNIIQPVPVLIVEDSSNSSDLDFNSRTKKLAEQKIKESILIRQRFKKQITNQNLSQIKSIKSIKFDLPNLKKLSK